MSVSFTFASYNPSSIESYDGLPDTFWKMLHDDLPRGMDSLDWESLLPATATTNTATAEVPSSPTNTPFLPMSPIRPISDEAIEWLFGGPYDSDTVHAKMVSDIEAYNTAEAISDLVAQADEIARGAEILQHMRMNRM